MDDYSHVNYRSAATLLAETKKALKEQVEIYVKERQDKKQQPSSMYSNSGNDSGGDEDEEEEDSDVNDLKDLITEATLSLARIYSKQGAVYTKLNSHLMALVRRIIERKIDLFTYCPMCANNDSSHSYFSSLHKRTYLLIPFQHGKKLLNSRLVNQVQRMTIWPCWLIISMY